MMFKQLQDMALFALVAECGSFTAAANRAGLPKSSVSQRVSQLEQALGLRLINRTTRQLNLTFAGERYLVHCQEMLQASERAGMAIERLRDNPSGRLRITSPAGIGATLLARFNTAFQQEYPDVTLDVSVSDEIRDLVQDGFDVALRTGRPQDSSLIGRRIGYCQRLLVASPEYLASLPPLTHPGQLSAHRCIAHRAWTEWVLKRDEEYYRWLLPPTHMTDNLVYARECALGKAGITLLPRFLTDEVLSQGDLVQVLPEWEVEGNELWLVYPSRKLNSPALSRFIDFAMQSPVFREFYT
ncbi:MULTISPECIES: LysR family transcriptional regulator [Erwinia]|nr:LysR family transcriptional regulator [Erwinia rhapontici]NKG28907.1 LysR family transcriptional regulator [Erwinia rhapontici]NNS07995.1 LysR family transcriptional regulator [Erwinia sp. JH02]UDQ82658.1 LysR family transcriptional regulator [Erwinia rhapontici]